MLICSCNVISESDIEIAILDLLEEDKYRLIVPVQVYHTLEKRGKCCGCFANVVDIIVRVTEAYHRDIHTLEHEIADMIARLQAKHREWEECRSARHRELSLPKGALSFTE